MFELNQAKSSGRGGRRKGAGRKVGSVTRKTRDIAEKAAAAGITPLEVLLQAMREAYEKDGAAAAVPYAKDAAPFVHARIAATELTGVGGKDLLPNRPVLNIAPGATPEQITALAYAVGALGDEEYDPNP